MSSAKNQEAASEKRRNRGKGEVEPRVLCGSPNRGQLMSACRKQCLAGWGKGSREHYYCTAQRLTDACKVKVAISSSALPSLEQINLEPLKCFPMWKIETVTF